MTENRKQERVPVMLRIKLRYEDVGTFIDKFAVNLSRGGMFIASRSPKPVGTRIKFELKLADESTVVAGSGVVRWKRDFNPKEPRALHGMGIEFESLATGSTGVVDRVIAHRHSLGLADDHGLPRQAAAGPPPAAPAQAQAQPAQPLPAAAPPPEPPAPPKRPATSPVDMDTLDTMVDDEARLMAFLEQGDDSIERARRIARGALGESSGVDALDAILKPTATPAAESVDIASQELARMLGGQAVSKRGRPPTDDGGDFAPTVRDAERPGAARLGIQRGSTSAELDATLAALDRGDSDDDDDGIDIDLD